MPIRFAACIGRAFAGIYPSSPSVDRAELAVFVSTALSDAWQQRRRVRSVAALAGDLAVDLLRAWFNRSALPITTRSAQAGAHAPRRSPPMDRLSSDLRYAVRVLVRAPMFTTIAVIMLALGIGAATAVYAVVDGVLLRPFTYPHMDRLAILTERAPNAQSMSVAWPTFLDWRAMNDVFDELGVYRTATVTLTGGQEPERLSGSVVSASIFTSMGIPPLAGRVFGDADDAPGTARTAIISERLWRGRFGAREDLVGSTVTLNSEPFTIVGIMPAGMRFPSRLTDVWLPIGLFADTFPKSRGAHPGLTAVGRVKAGETFERAQLGMDVVARRLGESYPATNKQLTVNVASYYELCHCGPCERRPGQTGFARGPHRGPSRGLTDRGRRRAHLARSPELAVARCPAFRRPTLARSLHQLPALDEEARVMKWIHVASGLAVAVALTAVSCSSSTSTTGPTPAGGSGGGGSAGFGTLQVLMKDSPFSDADAVLVTFTEVSAHHTGAAWKSLPFADVASERTCDLKRLEEVTDLLGVGTLEAGHYTQLRLEVSRARLYFDNKSTGPACAPAIIAPLGAKADVTVPSGTIHLNRQFTIEPGQTTTITLDFDGDKSIKQTGNGKYMMQPVIAIMSVTSGSGQ